MLDASKFLPTSLVGSYPQPDWLIDREKLAGRFPPRVRAKELWRVAPEWLEQAQDDATLLAIRDQERAGLDIITDGEMRRESYSNRFATALEGVDIDNPGTALDRSGHPNPVPRVVGKVRRKHPVEVRDVQFLRANTDRMIKMTVPGPFTMSQQAQNDFYTDEEEMALDYAAAVNEEIKDLFAAGADIVQIDEPYMQARPEKARQFGLQGAQSRRSTASRGTTAVHICFGYAAIIHERPDGLFVPAGARRLAGAADLDRDGAVQARLLGAGEAAGQDHHPRRARSLRHDRRDAGDGGRAHPPRAAACAGRPHHRRARLRSKYLPRDVAFGKMKAMVDGAAIVRQELSQDVIDLEELCSSEPTQDKAPFRRRHWPAWVTPASRARRRWRGACPSSPGRSAGRNRLVRFDADKVADALHSDRHRLPDYPKGACAR